MNHKKLYIGLILCGLIWLFMYMMFEPHRRNINIAIDPQLKQIVNVDYKAANKRPVAIQIYTNKPFETVYVIIVGPPMY